MPRPLFTAGKEPVPIVQEAGWVPGLVWTGAENLAPTEIRSPDRPARSQSLYRLSSQITVSRGTLCIIVIAECLPLGRYPFGYLQQSLRLASPRLA